MSSASGLRAPVPGSVSEALFIMAESYGEARQRVHGEEASADVIRMRHHPDPRSHAPDIIRIDLCHQNVTQSQRHSRQSFMRGSTSQLSATADKAARTPYRALNP